MKRKRLSISARLAALAAVAIALSLSSCATMRRSADSALDADAKAVLQKSSETLAAAKSFSFRVQRDVPAQIADAAGMAKKADIRISTVRPNRVATVRSGEGTETRFFYDGSKITNYDTGSNAYADSEAPATTDAMIAMLAEKWGIRPPLAGLLVSKPFESAMQKAKGGKLVGEESIGDEPCHHLNFTGEGVIWDLWISTMDHLPRKFDVTVTELEGSPKGVTVISEWNLAAKFPEGHFQAKVPANATQREMDEMR